MSELALSPDEFTHFSVPHALCVAGEYQYCLGFGSLVAATQLRVQADVSRAGGDFEIALSPQEEALSARAGELTRRWEEVLAHAAPGKAGALPAVSISLGFGEAGGDCPAEALLGSPAVAVALACAVGAHSGGGRPVPAEQVARRADRLLSEFLDAAERPYRYPFYAECMGCLRGGASCVAPSSAPLDVQLLLPPSSLILALSLRAAPSPRGGAWEKALAGAMQKLRPQDIERMLSPEGEDAAMLFEVAPRSLGGEELALLYGIFRVREMIAQELELIGAPFLDHDRLAELCDEESALLEDYFSFPADLYRSVKHRAVENGALGGKLTYAFGNRPALLLLAPGRRDEVRDALDEKLDGYSFLAVEVEPQGVA